jgi:hypothetical protein
MNGKDSENCQSSLPDSEHGWCDGEGWKVIKG